MPMNRDALEGLGDDLVRLMNDAPDDTWVEWLRAPFEEAAGWGDIPLTTALKEAGARGNGLAQAIKHGHRRLVRDLLDMGESPTAKDANGDAPIHLAASLGHGVIVRTLLIEGAQVGEPDRTGRTPLHLASLSGDDVGVRALLAAGACPRDCHDSTDFCALDFAAYNGHVDVMKTLLGREADVNARGSTGRGVVHHAAEKNQVGVIQFLAGEIGVQVDCKDDGGITPLHVATTSGHLPALNALVAAGADVSLRTTADCLFDYGPGCDVRSALDFAAHAGHMDILKALVRHGADVKARSSPNTTLTALHHATGGNQLEAMRFLLDEGADVNSGRVEMEWTPISFAVEIKSPEAIQVLAQRGADLSVLNEDGFSPLSAAVHNLDFDRVKILLAAGANPSPPDEIFPALVMAVSSDARSEEMINLLLCHGADVNGSDSDGKGALHEATKQGSVSIIDLLVEAGAAVDGYSEGSECPPPLHIACGADDAYSSGVLSCDVVTALLGHGASMNQRDDEEYTPLHYASERRQAEMVDLLLRAGADESLVNIDMETPADRVKRRHSGHSRYEEFYRPVLRLLDGAPADRAWRRRGLLVLCRAFPDKARLAPERSHAKLPRAAKRRAPHGGGTEGVGGELSVATSGSAFNRVAWGLIRLEEEDIFRNVICFL